MFVFGNKLIQKREAKPYGICRSFLEIKKLDQDIQHLILGFAEN